MKFFTVLSPVKHHCNCVDAMFPPNELDVLTLLPVQAMGRRESLGTRLPTLMVAILLERAATESERNGPF